MIRRMGLFLAASLVLGAATLGADSGIWRDVTPQGKTGDGQVRHFRADDVALRERLALAPHETYADKSHSISIPMPDGKLSRFSIVESPVMEPGLAAAYEHIKTYKLYGIDDPIASGRATMMARGFSAMLQTSSGRVFIDPDESAGLDVYLSRYRKGQPAQVFSCGARRFGGGMPGHSRLPVAPLSRLNGNLLKYRLAIAATEEYVSEVGGTVSLAQAEIVKTINHVNQVYENDLGIRLVLVNDNDNLIESEDSGCLSNDDAFAILSENQVWTDGIIGASKYDIGHVFSTDPGGLALIESACNASIKAQGTSGLANPVSEIFYIDYVAHEIGHQLGADHSFNGTSGACQSNRNGTTAFEPGSGSTIMAYSGICGAENIQGNSDATFHAGSIDEINAFTSSGGSCFAAVANNNSDPVLSGVVNRTIPALTPFVLDNDTATDADAGDQLSYQWDQMDTGGETDASTFGQDLGDNPLFRSYLPRAESQRNFPALGTQLLGLTDEAEVLPDQARSLNFRLTVRDGANGQATDDLRITVDSGAGPFQITSHDTEQTITFGVGSITLTWDVADTDTAPINCDNVDIDLLTFSDADYSSYSVHSLVAGTANDGAEDLNLTPATDSHSRARLRVKCSDNVFYDISDADLVIDGTDPTPILFDDTDNTTYFNDNGVTLSRPASGSNLAGDSTASHGITSASGLLNVFDQPVNLPLNAGAECVIPVIRSSSGSSSFDPAWLLFIGLLVAGVKLSRTGSRRYAG